MSIAPPALYTSEDVAERFKVFASVEEEEEEEEESVVERWQ